MTEKYGTIFADPGRQLLGGTQLLGQYLETEKIEVADSARLFLWHHPTNRSQALWVAREWGFEPEYEVTWQDEIKMCLIGRRYTRTGKMPRLGALVNLAKRRAGPTGEFYDLALELSPGPYLCLGLGLFDTELTTRAKSTPPRIVPKSQLRRRPSGRRDA